MPYIFDEFLVSNREESISPFLTPDSKNWGKNLSLKRSILAAIFLAVGFGLSFVSVPLGYIFLSFVFYLTGIPALFNTFHDLKNFEINIDLLMTLAAFISLGIGSGFEGGLLLVLFELSASMEKAVSVKTKSALQHLQKIAPTTAQIVTKDHQVYEKNIREISLGDKIFVKTGELVPLDGILVDRSSSFNLVHLTGESLPVLKNMGEEIFAGAQNMESAITLQVTKTSSESTLARIIRLITEANESKPKVQRWLDRFGKIYSTSIIGLTLFFSIILPWIFSIPYMGEEGGIYRALAFLIAASPCALIIATPTAYLSAISSCARKGILIKGGVILDAIASCKRIAFDKTGTLTKGKLELHKIDLVQRGLEDLNESLALQLAFSLESNIVHPIATAIEEKAQKEHLKKLPVQNFSNKPGFGLEGTIELEGVNYSVSIGLGAYISEKLDKETKKALESTLSRMQKNEEVLATLLINQSIYVFHFADMSREKSSELIESLKKDLTPIMLTGDHNVIAKQVGASLGITQIYADLRPEDKLSMVEKLSKDMGLIMVGDGMNDAPALARATVGIAMGQIGSHVAIDASDVILLRDEVNLIDWLYLKAKKTSQIVRQNIILALSVICFATIPALLGFIPLWLAVLLHEGGTVLVGFNSLRLLKK